MGFRRQSPPSFRGGTSTRAPRNRAGNLQGAGRGRTASMAKQLRQPQTQTRAAQMAQMQSARGQQQGGGIFDRMRQMQQAQQGGATAQPMPAQQPTGATAQPIPAQQPTGATAQPMPVQQQLANLQGTPSAPTGQPVMRNFGPNNMGGQPQMGGKGGRAPQPPGQAPQGGGAWGSVGNMLAQRPQQGQQMGGKGRRSPQPQPYRGGKGGRSPRPPSFGG